MTTRTPGRGRFEGLGPVLRDLRRKRGLSQEEISVRTGLPKHRVSAIERGKEEPGLEAVGKLLEGLEAGVAELGRRLDRARRIAAGEPEPPEELHGMVRDIAEGFSGTLWHGLRPRWGLPAASPPAELREWAAEAAEALTDLVWHGLRIAGLAGAVAGSRRDEEEGPGT